MIPKNHRINRLRIPYILRKGSLFNTDLFIIRHTENKKEVPRFRTIVSKKMHKQAVDRNKLRRRIYRSINLCLKELTFNKNQDIILIPKKKILGSSFQEIFADIKTILCKI